MSTTTMTHEERKIARKYQKAYNRILCLFAACLIVAVALTAVIVSSVNSRPILVQASTESVYVEEGDTLWNICEEYAPNSMDIRKYIQIVKDYNDKTDATIYTGELIELPIFTVNRY